MTATHTCAGQRPAAPITVAIDATPLSITSLNVPSCARPGFSVSWSVQDSLGISRYDVQYRRENGEWTDRQMGVKTT